MGMYQAAMDIGTNSCRLVIVEMTEKGDVTHERQTRITRIGQGLGGGSLHIGREAMDRTLAALAEYKTLIGRYPVNRVRLMGTQALREADNGRDFAAEVKEKLGFELEIISGEREAFLSYAGVAGAAGAAGVAGVAGRPTGMAGLGGMPDVPDPAGLMRPATVRPLVLDIGAGSTELLWAEEDGTVRGASAPVGCLRLLERPMDSDGILAALTAGWGGMKPPEERDDTGRSDATGQAGVGGADTAGEGADGAGAGRAGSGRRAADGVETAGTGQAIGGQDVGGAEAVNSGQDVATGGGVAGVAGVAGADGVAGAVSKRPLIGVGGTATTLGAVHLRMKVYDPAAFSGLRLSRRQVTETAETLEAMSSAERLALPGMLPGREDVLPWGLRILLAAMEYCRRDSVMICDRDLLYGVLYER